MRASVTVISAFTDEQAARLTGLSVQQLRHWDKTDFFKPSLAADNRRSAYSRVYNFQDLVELQVLKRLRKDLGCSLQHLREVKEKLEELGEARWATTTLFVLSKRVVFHDQSEDALYEPVSNQKVFKIPLEVVRSDMREAVSELWSREPETFGEFEKRKGLVYNKEVISGTRVPVKTIRDFIAAGYNNSQIMEEFPSLRRPDIDAIRNEKAA
ncbi:MAG: DUF433 domain-containing protein [Pseudomonadota bacterium]|nr:DUF433 domain-containing protein [Pseudomonadota bacterium]